MRSSSQTGRTGNSSNRRSGMMPLTAIGIASIILSILLMAIFCMSAYAGNNKRNPIVRFYNVEGDFPKTSMTNTLHAAGFNMEISDGSMELESDEKYVIAVFGDDAIDLIHEYKDNSNVLGFVLICPLISEGQSLDGISSNYPSKDIAIFAGKDKTSDVSSISDSRILYERLSGDDTVYGTPIKRGGLFASSCFINNSQNRYLSLSSFSYDSYMAMTMSPLFQNELAGYLGITYQHDTIKDISFARINSWFVMIAVAILAFVFGEALYLALLPVTMKEYVKTAAPVSEKIATMVTLIVAAVSVIGVVLLFTIDSLRRYSSFFICALPVVFMAAMVFSKLKVMLDKDDNGKRNKDGLLRPLFMALSVALIVFLVSFAFGDLSVNTDIPDAVIAVLCFVFDALLAGMLFNIDRNARSLKQGGSSYFGNLLFIVLMTVPAIVMIILGLITGMSSLRTAGIGGVIITLIPYLSVVPIRRHSENTLIASILHGVVFTVLFLLIA